MSKIIVTTADELTLLIENVLKNQSTPKATPSPKLLNIDEASEFLNLAKQTLYGFTSKSKIPFIKRGKKLYFRLSELETWLNEGKRKSIAEIEREITGSN